MILLVDDNEPFRRVTAEQLQTSGYEVSEAADAASALAALRPAVDRCELLLTDFDMPGENGVELVRRARLLAPDLPVLMITSSAPSELGEIDFPVLRKPFAFADLEAAVEGALASGGCPLGEPFSHETPSAPETPSALGSAGPADQGAPSTAHAPSTDHPARSRVAGRAGPGPGPGLLVPRAPLVPLVSLLALVLAGLGLVWIDRVDPAQPLPDPAIDDPRRGSAIFGLEPTGPLAGTPVEWRWQAVAGAARYRLSVLDVDDETVWTVETEVASVVVPPEIRARFVPHVAYYLSVSAFDDAGLLLATVRDSRFRVVPAPDPRS